jgi:hypothetical protein
MNKTPEISQIERIFYTTEKIDLSNALSFEATPSAGSASTENETEGMISVSDDVEDIYDSHSIQSETAFSISSDHIKSRPLKNSKTTKAGNKASATISHLKSEIALLQEALHRSNVTDITVLETKLRGAKLDLAQVRKHNNELKQRIQNLESKLYDALEENRKLQEKIKDYDNVDISFESCFSDIDHDISYHTAHPFHDKNDLLLRKMSDENRRKDQEIQILLEENRKLRQQTSIHQLRTERSIYKESKYKNDDEGDDYEDFRDALDADISTTNEYIQTRDRSESIEKRNSKISTLIKMNSDEGMITYTSNIIMHILLGLCIGMITMIIYFNPSSHRK